MSANFLTAPLAEVVAYHAAALAGDANAREYFAGLFGPDAPCALCDEPVGPRRTTGIMADPANPKMALLLPHCATCATLPLRIRQQRQLAFARHLWPGLGMTLRHSSNRSRRRAALAKARAKARR